MERQWRRKLGYRGILGLVAGELGNRVGALS
jgi:hypothetical protein